MRQLPSQILIPIGGMNQDITAERLSEGQYIEAENLLPVDTEGTDTGIGANAGRSARLTTVRSDALALELPAIPDQDTVVLCAEVIDAELPYEILVALEFDVDGSPVSELFEIDSPLWIDDLAAAINSSPTVSPWVYAVAECDCLTVRPRSFRVTDLDFSDSGSSNVTLVFTPGTIPGQALHFCIGECSTNDYLVLITTAPENHYPATTPPLNYGQVWAIPIDTPDGTLAPIDTPALLDLALAYHGELNLSRYHQMTKVEAAPESECLMNVVFTDNYNPLRILNVLDPMATRLLPPGLLRLLQPEAKLPPITFLGQGNGQLLHGAYIYTYRLLGPTGQVTPWAQPTTRINNLILNTDAGANDYQYTRAFATGAAGGGGANAYDVGSPTNNSNQLQIAGIDTDYITAEVACLYYELFDGPPTETFIIGRYTISGDTLAFTHASMLQEFPEITAEEIAIDPVFINTAKTFTQSESRLLIGNYCTGYDLEYTQVIGANPGDITLDFVRHRLLVDTTGNVALTYAYLQYIKGHPMSSAVGLTDNDYTTATGYAGSPQITLNGNPQFLDHKGSYIEYLTRGYMSNEWYRLGIVFHLKSGQRTLPYWIGNAQIPSRGDGLASLNYPISEVDTFNAIGNYGYVNPIGISLSGIDVSAIADQIQGFSIVRSEPAQQVIAGGFFDVIYTPRVGTFAEGYFYSPDIDSLQANYFFEDGDYILISQEVQPSYGAGTYKYYTVAAPTDYALPGLVDSIQLPIANAVFDSGIITGVNLAYNSRGAGLSRLVITSDSVAAWQSIIALMPGVVAGSRLGFYAQIIRPGTPFDGDTEQRLRDTEWYYTNHYQPVDACNLGDGNYVYDAIVYGGDTQMDLYSRIEQVPAGNSGLVFSYQNVVAMFIDAQTCAIFPAESRINSTLRSIPDEATQTFAEVQVSLVADKIEVHANREVFIRNGIVPLIGEDSAKEECSDCFPNAIVPTAVRIPGAAFNFWQVLQVNNQTTLEFKYGQINRLETETEGSSVVLAWQENAVALVPVGSQQLATDGATVELTAGNGTVIGTPRYASFEYGTQHVHSVARTPQGFVFTDAARRAHLLISGRKVQSLSELKGMRTWMNRKLGPVAYLDNPCLLGGLHANYDYEHDLATLTLKYSVAALEEDPVWVEKEWLPVDDVNEWTLLYSTNFENYPAFYSPVPAMFISIPGNRFLSFNPTIGEADPIDPEDPNSLYRHFARFTPQTSLLFYGAAAIEAEGKLPRTPTPARLMFVVNQEPGRTKSLHNFRAIMNKVWNQVKVSTNEQTFTFPGNQLESLDFYTKYRGEVQLAFARSIQGKWQWPGPPMLEWYNETDGWAELAKWVNNARAEFFYVDLSTDFTDVRDLGQVESVFTFINRNT